VANAEELMEWMDLAIAEVGDDRLSREGGVLRFGDDLKWVATLDERGEWYAHYICEIREDQYVPPKPFWTQHQKLRSEPSLREHVRKAVAEFTRA
jgi:hypothetical protein